MIGFQLTFLYRPKWRRNAAGGVSLVSMLLFGGCVVGPKYQRPVVLTPPAYKETGNWKPAKPNDQKATGTWWEVFADSQLNALEQQVNVSNQSLKAALAQYDQARALFRYNRANYYPTLTTSPSATRIHDATNRPPQSSIYSGITYNDYVFPVELSYQADVFGRIRRTVEQYKDQAEASAADLATVSLSMHADLALDYFEARTLDAEERLLNDTVRQYQEALELNQKLFGEGMTSILTVQQAQTQLETTRAAAIDVGVLRAQYEHAVAVLVGKPPETFGLPPLPLTTPPPPIPVGVPSDLLERRPDIASAERMVAAANAQIGVAASAYYPLINLTAAAGFESGSITTLLQGPGALWSFGPSAVETILDFGRRRAVSNQARAEYNQAVANYRQTVLTGFQQVEDNLAALRVLQQEAEAQRTGVTAAQAALDTSMTLFRGGLTSYLTVTTAQTTLLTDQVTSINILGRRMSAAVLLIQALGGGWDASTLKSTPVATSAAPKTGAE
jgi:NodT family efflux transporter outer membrane factor (OMF) lipoprotein